MEEVNSIVLSLGSNIENRLVFLKSAISKIEKTIGLIVKKSSIYESEALGFQSEIPFYNICIAVDTKLSPLELLQKTQEIEIEIGRKKRTSDRYESREIDIDIIFFGDEIINFPQLKVPHKLFQERKFVLLPLIEIHPEKIDPKSKHSTSEILKMCNDRSSIKKTNQPI